jgi:YbbR domain-containing protein
VRTLEEHGLLKEALFDNLGAKLMALVMAMALWLYATGRHTGELNGTVSIEVLYPPGYTLLSQSVTEVNVRLKGPKNSIDYISDLMRDRKVVARCGITVEGGEKKDIVEETLVLDKKSLSLPPEIKVESISPNRVKLAMSRLEKKSLRVQLQKRGEPAPGYSVASEFFYPFEAQVTGPAGVLKDATTIMTVPIDLSNLTPEQNRTFPWRVALEQVVTVNREGDTITVPVVHEGDVKINVWLELAEERESRTFEKVGVKVLEPPDFPFKVKLHEEHVSLKVKGPKLVLDKMSPPEVYIDVSGLETPGPYKQPIRCNLPPQIELQEKLPELHLDILEEQVAKK